MSEKDLEAIITQILESSVQLTDQGRKTATTNSGGKNGRLGRPLAVDRSKTYLVRRRKGRPQRNPLRASMRLIFAGVVVLCVPLLFL